MQPVRTADRPLTTLHLWRVPASHVPAAIARMGSDRPRLRRVPGLRFAKLLGTGDGRTFDLRDADPRTWALLAVWDDPAALAAFERSGAVAAGWRALAAHTGRVDMVAVASRGRWAGVEPFLSGEDDPAHHEQAPAPRAADAAGGDGAPPRWQPPPEATASRWPGPVAAITRARLRPSRMRRFWAAVPPVAADLAGARGLHGHLGIGEAPIGLQGTFSLWDSAQALTDFAYRTPAHLDAVRRTPAEGWYVEELFARFAVLQTTGTVLTGGCSGPGAWA